MVARHPRKKKDDEDLDEAVEDTFPASDPPAMTVPTVPGAPEGEDEDEDEDEDIDEEEDDEDEDDDEEDEDEDDEDEDDD